MRRDEGASLISKVTEQYADLEEQVPWETNLFVPAFVMELPGVAALW